MKIDLKILKLVYKYLFYIITFTKCYEPSLKIGPKFFPKLKGIYILYYSQSIMTNKL